MKAKKIRTHCPINFVIELFGDKWTMLIIRDLLIFGKRNYGAFLSSGEKISTNILANRLNMLEQEGLVRKTRDPRHGSKFNYTPTRKAVDLLPVLMEMIVWSAKYDSHTLAPAEFIERVKMDRAGVIKEFQERLETAERQQSGF